MYKTTSRLILLAALTCCVSCFEFENPYSGIAPGPWRAVLFLEPKFITPNPKGKPLPEKLNLQFEEVSAGELPFVFDVVYDNDTEFHLVIYNGEERIETGPVKIGRDIATGRDTLQVDFPVFDSKIKGFYEENMIEGKWIVNNRKREGDLPYEIPFLAKQGQNHRFTALRKAPKLDLSGKWEATFEIERDEPYKAIGEFSQEGNRLLGTFLTETGDYRFLEGTVQANKAYLSVFDGSHAFLFEAKIQDDSTLLGSFRSGIHYRTLWEARRNPDFELTPADELTFLREGHDQFEFSFINQSMDTVSLKDERYRNKVKVVQIMGTWCPNCRDETNFLKEYLQKYPDLELEVIALAFERHSEQDKAIEAIKRYRQHMEIDYEVLLAGGSSKDAAGKALPMLNHVLAFPSMVFIDKQDRVRKIHTGFQGPATSIYPKFLEDFDETVRTLTAE